MIIKKLYLSIILIILLCIIYFISKTERLTINDLNGNEYKPTQKYTQDSNIISTPTPSSGNAPKGQLNSIAVDKYGNIYVSSLIDNNIYMYVSTPNYLNSTPANSYFGLNLTKGDIRNLPVIFDQTGSYLPTSLAIDNNGNLYCSVCSGTIASTSTSFIYMLCNTTNKSYNNVINTTTTTGNSNYTPAFGSKNKIFLGVYGLGITSIAVDNYSNVFFLCNAGSTTAGIYVSINDSSKCIFYANYQTPGKVYLLKIANPQLVVSIKLSYNGNLLFINNTNGIIRVVNLEIINETTPPTTPYASYNTLTTATPPPTITTSIYSNILNDIIYRDYSNNLNKLTFDSVYKTSVPIQVTYKGEKINLSAITGISTFTNFTIDNNNNIYIINSAIPSDKKASTVYKIDNLTGVINKFFNCPINQFINSEYNGCVASCSNPSFISYDGSACINSCNPTQLNGESGNACVPKINDQCPPGFLLTTNSEQCVTQCNNNQTISLDYTKCIISSLKLIIQNTGILSLSFDINNNIYYSTSTFYKINNILTFKQEINTGRDCPFYTILNNSNTPTQIRDSNIASPNINNPNIWLVTATSIITPPTTSITGIMLVAAFIGGATSNANKTYLFTLDIINTNGYYSANLPSWNVLSESVPGLITNFVKQNNRILYSYSNIIYSVTITTNANNTKTINKTQYQEITVVKPSTQTNIQNIIFTADSSGNIYFVDKNPQSLYTSGTYYSGIWMYLKGTTGKYLNVTANTVNSYYQIAKFSNTTVNVTSMIMDSSNNLYFTDTVTNVINKIDNNGVISIFANTYSNGSTTVPFNYPSNLTFDSSGILYVTDMSGIYKVSSIQENIISCPSLLYIANNSKSCVDECPSDQFILDNKSCVNSCPL
jgi:sugar lactone lactonase YvrE